MFNNDTQNFGHLCYLHPNPIGAHGPRLLKRIHQSGGEAVVDMGDMLLGRVYTVLSLYSLHTFFIFRLLNSLLLVVTGSDYGSVEKPELVQAFNPEFAPTWVHNS